MAVSPNILALNALLAPIPGDNPAGPDLRQDASPSSVYFKIKDARTAARAAERNSELDAAAGGLSAEWRAILNDAPAAIAGQSKDLEIAAWLVEALVRANGFAGLRDGFRLLGGLVDKYWDKLYPTPDEDGVATRVGPLSGLNGEGADGTLIHPIRRVMITQGQEPGPFAFWHYEQAGELLKLEAPKAKARVDAGAVTLEIFQTSARQSTVSFYVTLRDDLRAALEEYQKLCALLEAKAGKDGPPTTTIRNTIQAVLECVEFVSRDIIPPEPVAEEAAAAETGDGASPDAPAKRAAAASGAIETREDALKVLLKAAEFFRKFEPQSPVSYALEDAVRRARLPLPELLSELIPNADARKQFLIIAGIKPPTEQAPAAPPAKGQAKAAEG